MLCSILYFLELPIFDYWDVLNASASLEGKGFREHLDFYWAPFVDQRMVFPKLLIERLFSWTGNNHYGLEIAFGFLCQGLCVAICYAFGPPSEQVRERRIRLGVTLLLLFWPYLSFRFQHHWYSTQYSLAITPGLLSIYLVHRSSNWWSTAFAFLCVVVSALSHGTGLLLAFTWAGITPFYRRWTPRQRMFFTLGNALLVVLVLSLKPAQSMSQIPPLAESLSHPDRLLLFFIRCFGPKIHDGLPGVLLFTVFVAALFRLKRSSKLWQASHFPWLVIGLWSVAVAAGSAFARASLWSTPSHVYYSFFVLFNLTTFHFAWSAGFISLPKTRKGYLLGLPILVYLLALYGTGVEKGLRHARVQKRKMQRLKRSLNYATLTQASDLDLIFPHPRIRSEILPNLYQRALLPDFIKFEQLTIVTELKATLSVHGNELRVKLPRPLKKSEVIQLQSDSKTVPTVHWQVNESWSGDRWAPLVKFRQGELWFRPSARFATEQDSFKITGMSTENPMKSVRVYIWSYPER